MATLLIEGDPGAIHWLWAELDDRNYLRGEFRVREVEWNALAAPDLLDVNEIVASRPAEAQAMMEREGFVIDDLSDRWQKFAFTLYTYLAEDATQAEAAIAKAKENEETR